MKGDREKSIAAGASDYITKPVDIDQLVSLMRVWLYGDRRLITTASSSASSSSCCSRPSTGATATTSAATRAASLRRRLWRRADLEGLRTLSGLQERVLHDPACMERLLARPLDQRHRDVPRPGLPPRRCASEVLPAAAHLPVHPHLDRGLLDGRGGRARSRSRCTRRGCSSARASTRPTWTPTCSAGARAGAFPLEQDAATTRATTSRPAGRRRSRAYYTVARRRGASFDPALLRDGRLRPAQPGHRPLVQRVPPRSSAATC